MDDKKDSKRHFEMEVEVQNDDLEFPEASTFYDVEGTTHDSQHIRGDSPISTEDLLKETFSNLSLNGSNESDSYKEEMLKIPASTNKKRSKLMLPNTISGKGESIYNLCRSFKNPVTGLVTKIGAKRVQSQVSAGCKQNDRPTSAFTHARPEITNRTVGDGSLKKPFQLRNDIKPKPYTPRNPITGDGIQMVKTCPSKKQRSFSGIRVTQPSGGRSSNIF